MCTIRPVVAVDNGRFNIGAGEEWIDAGYSYTKRGLYFLCQTLHTRAFHIIKPFSLKGAGIEITRYLDDFHLLYSW
jgi:hypothetical protein